MKDGKTRSLLKAFSWRITATMITIIASWFVLGDITPALSIGFLEFFSKLFVYYAHERAWVHIPLGRPAVTEVKQEPSAVKA